jgi:hypothetical protein
MGSLGTYPRCRVPGKVRLRRADMHTHATLLVRRVIRAAVPPLQLTSIYASGWRKCAVPGAFCTDSGSRATA